MNYNENKYFLGDMIGICAKKEPLLRQVGAKKEYTPFPPPQKPSKIDLQLESGEYFLSKEVKEAKAATEKQDKQQEKVAERKKQREDAFVAPKVRFTSSAAF